MGKLEDAFFEGLGGVYEPNPTFAKVSKEEDSDDVESPKGTGIGDIEDIEHSRGLTRGESGEEAENRDQMRYAELLYDNPITKDNLFSHPEAHPFTLDVTLIDKFGLEWLTWSPDTIFTEIEKGFNTKIWEMNKLKILVVSTLHESDIFWNKWEVFEKAILVLNNIMPRGSYMQPLDVSMLIAGVDMVKSIRDEEFGEEVIRYMTACFLNDNVSYAPEPVSFIKDYLCNLRYKCGECSKEGSALPPFDGRCDSCSRKFEDGHPLNFKKHPEANDDPSKVKVFCQLDPLPTKNRLEELLKIPEHELTIDETPDDIEAARLIVAIDYMNFRRDQKTHQLAQMKGSTS